MASVERLYKLYSIVSDTKLKAKHEAAFKEILTGVKSDAAQRKLSAQFISRFFADFPKLQEQSVNALFDLCEDDDVAIRKMAIKELPGLCKTKPDLVPKVADILAQLLQMEDAAEVNTVHASLMALFKIDAKGVLTGIFYQIENSSGEETVREKCIEFLNLKLPILGSEVITMEIEALIVTEAKKILKNASEEEFLLMLGVMRTLKTTKTPKGYKQLVDLVAAQINLEKPLDTTDIENVHKVSSCVKAALPYFSFQIPSTNFIEYMFREIVPVLKKLDAVTKAADAEATNNTLTLDLVRSLAQLIRFGGTLEELETKVTAVFTQLLVLMPLPPDVMAANKAVESGVSFEFSNVECLLYIFHQMAKNHTEFLTKDADRLKDFRARLTYFARACQAYQRRLKEALANKKGSELKADETKIKKIALRTTENITSLIRDLFHTVPSYKATIALSWVPPKGKTTDVTLSTISDDPAPAATTTINTAAAANGAEKRHQPITFDSPSTKSQKSEKTGTATGGGSGGRGRGSGRGGFKSGRGSFRKY